MQNKKYLNNKHFSKTMHNNIKLIAGSSNPSLAAEIAQHLHVPLTKVKVSNFIDGETYVKIEENMREADVFVIQSTCYPVNENLMQLLIMVDALRRASAKRITAVIPYYGYARQDRKATSREPITAKLVANLLVAAGVNRVLTVDLHADQIQGFFDIPLDHLRAQPVIVDYLKQKKLNDFVVVAPDEGRVKENFDLAEKLHLPLVIIAKQRSKKHLDTFEMIKILGEVKDKHVIMIDDQIQTGGTLYNAVKILKENGAKEIHLACTHPIFAGPATERMSDPAITEVIVTNTIPLRAEIPNVIMISIAPLLGEAIRRIHEGESVSSLFE